MARQDGGFWSQEAVKFGIAYWTLTISLNVIITLLIVGRLVARRRQMRFVLGDDNVRMYTSISAMLIESMALYSIWGLVFLVTYARSLTLSNLLLPPLGQIQAIATLLIIARVAQGRGWSRRTSQSAAQRLQAFQFVTRTDEIEPNTQTNDILLGDMHSLFEEDEIHALVARGNVILAEHQAGKRDFSQATQTILSKIPPNNSKLTYVWEQFLFHHVSEGGFTYLVMADDSAGRRMPFAFLAELQRAFTSLPSSSSSLSSLPAHGLQGSFSPTIATLMETYNTAPPTDELARAQTELNQVKDIMVQNVEQILSRGERIELLVDKTDNMANQATAFRRGARGVRRQMWWKNSKITALGIIVGLVLLWIIVAQFCGVGFNRCGKSNNKSDSNLY
ncbi:hypothetical protein HWV62_26594 [Athelia sp. TMB]|nr:hypothetical protein HWV62_26594 [Athelia sp. TMB]